jgi:hypothetical protein
MDIHACIHTCLEIDLWIYRERERVSERERERKLTETQSKHSLSQYSYHCLPHSFSHINLMTANTIIDRHSTSMPKVFCTFQTPFPLIWILLPGAAICACLHDGHALAPGSRQPCAGPGWLHFSVHCAEHHPWQLVSVHTHTHTHTQFTRQCLHLCVYTDCPSSGWVSDVYWSWIAWCWDMCKALHKDACRHTLNTLNITYKV